MSFALVFSGQGTQHPAMLPWLDDGDEIVRSTCAMLGVADWRGRAEDPAWATSNATAQVLITGLALAAWRQLARLLPPPTCIAGYSVGELAAFCAAGVFEVPSALALARARAAAMDRCAARAPGGLVALVGLPLAEMERLGALHGLDLAIRNGADSGLLGGPNEALGRAEREASALGGRTTRLAVEVASHTRWMQPASDDFAQTLRGVRLNAPRVALFGNARDRVRTAAGAAQALTEQISTTVRWDDCMDGIRGRSPACVLEVGAGQSLARIWARRYPEVPARACDDFRSARAVSDWVAAQQDR